MSTTLIITLTAIFVSIALLTGLAASRVLAWTAPERKRLRNLSSTSVVAAPVEGTLTVETAESLGVLAKALPSAPKELSRLRRELVAAGHNDLASAAYFSASKIVAPVILGILPLLLLPIADAWILTVLGAIIGYLLPDFALARMQRAHARAIENGLPDVLDLLIICIEAGSSLDQGIVKATEDLDLTHPVLAAEMRLITTEIRAGKPRLDAFRNFAARTRVDDVRSLVTMLTQTDRFGTSVSQALRIHAETSRTKRRQRAEERAAKVGVKLVFPLVLCVFPAVYVVCIGSAFIAIYRGLL